MHILWWGSLIFLLMMAFLLLRLSQRPRMPSHAYRRFSEVLGHEGFHLHIGGDVRNRLERWLDRLSGNEKQEMSQLLIQAGWGTPDSRFYFLVAAWMLPFASGLLAGTYAVIDDRPATDVLLHGLFGFALVFIIMRRFLRWRAQRRQTKMRSESITLLHLLRMLFDAGLSLEHILTVIQQQGRSLIPNLAHELGMALRRIQAGYDRTDALTEMAVPLQVPELNDIVLLIKQATRFGGNVRDQLIDYTKLAEQRQASELREYVSKLSAKMTIIMILFLFPALMIFVAGPGLIGLTNALKTVGS